MFGFDGLGAPSFGIDINIPRWAFTGEFPDFHKKKVDELVVEEIVKTVTNAWQPPIFNAQRSTQPVSSLDLGSIFTDLGTAYINAKWGGQTNDRARSVNAVFNGMDQFASQNPAFLNNLGIPGIDVVPDAPTGDCNGRKLYDPAKGKWITQRRRRRKRLATPSDLKDLAALRGVLGNGEAFKTWRATHD